MCRVNKSIAKTRITTALVIACVGMCALIGCGKGQAGQKQSGQNEQAAESSLETTDIAITTGDEYDDTDYSAPDNLTEKMREKRSDVDYGTMDDRVKYYSSTIGEEKECGVLLPAGYTDRVKYPVIYVLHGNGGDHYDWNRDDSYLQSLYGNMRADGEAVPAIIVMVDMWTAPASTHKNPTIDVQLNAYDEFYKDLKNDLMPYITTHYSVQEGREATAIVGTSMGATEALICGFEELDQIGYIGALAPCGGVVYVPDYKDGPWNTPVLDDLVIPDESLTPYYIQLTVGSIDPWCIHTTQYLDQVMTNNQIQHTYYMVDGLGHEDALWINGLYQFIRRIF